MLAAFREQADTATPTNGSAVASDRWGKPIDLAAPFLRANVPAVKAAHPELADADFHDHGTTKDGALVRLSLAKRQALGVSK